MFCILLRSFSFKDTHSSRRCAWCLHLSTQHVQATNLRCHTLRFVVFFFSFGYGIRPLVLVFCVDPQWHESHGSSLDQVVVGEEVARLCLLHDCDVRCHAPAGNPLSVVSQIIVSSSCQFGSCTSLLRHQPQIWKSTAEISTGSPRVPGLVQFREAARTSPGFSLHARTL